MKFVIHKIAKEGLIFSELKVKHYKDILKCVFGDEPSTEGFVETLYDLLQDIGTKKRNFYEKLNIYQIFQILTELRIQVFGEECIINVQKNEAKCTLHLNLANILSELNVIIEQFEHSSLIEDGINVKFGIPTIERLSNTAEEDYINFVKSITVKNKTLNITDNDTAKNLLDNLTPKLSLKIIKHCEDFFQTLLNYNLLSVYGITEQKLIFVPTIDNLIWFCKLYFSEPLDSFYENMFFLSHHGKMEASYIENCTPGEYIFLTKKLVATLKEKNSSEDELQH